MSDDEQLALVDNANLYFNNLDYLNAAVSWETLPEMQGHGRDVSLVLTFETDAERERFVAGMKLFAKKDASTQKSVWRAWWPPRREDYPGVLSFDLGDV